MEVGAVIVAAGRGNRMGADVNKVFLPLCGKSVLAWSVQAFMDFGVRRIAVVLAPGEEGAAREALKPLKGEAQVTFANGGAQRTQSVCAGLCALGEGIDYVLIHDGARPLVTGEVIGAALASAREKGSGIAALPVKDTIKLTDGEGKILSTPERANLYAVQTPQAFCFEAIMQAHAAAAQAGANATDDAALLEEMGQMVYLSKGDEENIKLTTPQDMALARQILRRRQGARPGPRIGTGFDVHALVQGRALILGGVNIPYEKGLLGHSDADVLTHAVMDALLGAAALGDIGKLFPDNDPAYAGADSIALLEQVAARVRQAGYAIGNVDATIVAQAPKCAPHIGRMRENLARAMGIGLGQVGLKATTTEHMGFEGRGEGISAQAAAILYPSDADI
ncbi:2-C-methyl-D-erythritol 4-phosphate cytidylyltransferase [Christensenellaceae bacterium NSJ-44]|uniref:Bifunctional enzyme IspD/IspF n=1 Tax=Luoshenia tenuis TaxID=2763654 RepID=A0A926D430_9FIRM|nr:2-C-methyl-D-erythritol 4-phosphate cytidylyltransferase [Luoshenia tenuis]MBC8529980.1 2-C-methyl-D-erythritol 4-phosphate cytidylyltransferase [Luoshenia tenuis]